MVPGRRNGSCGTAISCDRSVEREMVETSRPSMEILPDSRSRSRNNAESREDFPLFVCQ
jgi:hypothetical protein